jgi:hypothetical protein
MCTFGTANNEEPLSNNNETAGTTHSLNGVYHNNNNTTHTEDIGRTKRHAVRSSQTGREHNWTPAVRRGTRTCIARRHAIEEISYEVLGLTPTKMRQMMDVLDQMKVKVDGVWGIDIEKMTTEEDEVVRFDWLSFSTSQYSKGFYTLDLEPVNPISRIQTMHRRLQ